MARNVEKKQKKISTWHTPAFCGAIQRLGCMHLTRLPQRFQTPDPKDDRDGQKAGQNPDPQRINATYPRVIPATHPSSPLPSYDFGVYATNHCRHRMVQHHKGQREETTKQETAATVLIGAKNTLNEHVWGIQKGKYATKKEA